MTQQAIPFGKHDAAAQAWIDANPAVFAIFERFALELAAEGRRFGIGLLTERVRWEVAFVYRRHDWKINNSHRAYIARALIRRHPQLAELVETRAQHA
jgi:hypothetical protein